MLSIAVEMVSCLIVASIIGFLIGYLCGRVKECEKGCEECERDKIKEESLAQEKIKKSVNDIFVPEEDIKEHRLSKEEEEKLNIEKKLDEKMKEAKRFKYSDGFL